MDTKKKGKNAEDITYKMMNNLESMRQEIRMEMEKLKGEMKCRETEWVRERNELKERIEKLEVRWEEYNKNEKNEIEQLEKEREEMDSRKENVECMWNRRLEKIKASIEKFERNIEAMQEEKRKNNTKNTLNSTSIPIPPPMPTISQLQSIQSASTSTESAQNSSDVNSIAIPSTSGCAQNQNSNISQPNESNGLKAVDIISSTDTISNEGSHTSLINLSDYNTLVNILNQFGSRDSHNTNNITNKCNIDNNVEIMCNCGQRAIQLTVKKDTPNKGRLFYKCKEGNCKFFKWENNVEFQNAEKHSNVSNLNRNNDNSGHFSGASTSNNNWENPSMNFKCICNQPAQKLIVIKNIPNKGRQLYACHNWNPWYINNCDFFMWANENDSKFFQNASTPKKLKLTEDERKCEICGIEGHMRKQCPNVISVGIYYMMKLYDDKLI